MNPSALESRDDGLEITTRAASIPIGDRAATNYGNRATVVGTKHAVIETKTETWAFRSGDHDRDLGLQVSRPRQRPGQNELESRDHGLEITTLDDST